MVGVVRVLVLPREGDESGKGRSEKSTASQREPHSLRGGRPFSVKVDVQSADATGVSGFGEGLELEVPLARVPLVGHQPPSTSLVARTTLPRPTYPSSFHRNIQRGRITPFETHLDKGPTIVVRNEDCGPHSRLVNQRHPPKSADVRQLREIVRAPSDTWGCDNLENPKEDFDGNVVDGTEFWFWRRRIAWTVSGRSFL